MRVRRSRGPDGSALNVIGVCSDASVAYQWFHSEDEDPVEVEASRNLVRIAAQGRAALWVLDLTRYECGNALLSGRAKVTAEQVARALDALDELCPVVVPTASDLHEAARLAERHRLTLYDAIYAAVARLRGAELATLDTALLRAGLGRRPSEIVGLARREANGQD